MAVTRNKLSRKFSTVPNQIITDISISADALRVYLYLLSKPDGWQVVNSDIKKTLEIKQDQTLANYWKQLIKAGWISRERLKNDNGVFIGGYDYQLNDAPILPEYGNNHNVEEPQYGKTLTRENPQDIIKTEIDNSKTESIISPLTPQGGGENKVAGTPIEKGSNLIIADPSQNPNFFSNEPTDQQVEAVVNTWLTMIEDKIKTKNWIGFTRFELLAIEFRARQFPKLRTFEIENELVLLDKLAWEGKDIENVLRSGYRSLASVKAVLRTEHDSAGNRVYDLERLNTIRQNRIAQDRANQGGSEKQNISGGVK